MSMTSSVEDAELIPDIVTEETSLSVKDLSLFYGQNKPWQTSIWELPRVKLRRLLAHPAAENRHSCAVSIG